MGKIDFRAYHNLLMLSQLGLMMFVPIVGGVFVGNWLDSKLGTSPLFLFLGIIIFTISGFMNLYEFVMRQTKQAEALRREKHEEQRRQRQALIKQQELQSIEERLKEKKESDNG